MKSPEVSGVAYPVDWNIERDVLEGSLVDIGSGDLEIIGKR